MKGSITETVPAYNMPKEHCEVGHTIPVNTRLGIELQDYLRSLNPTYWQHLELKKKASNFPGILRYNKDIYYLNVDQKQRYYCHLTGKTTCPIRFTIDRKRKVIIQKCWNCSKSQPKAEKVFPLPENFMNDLFEPELEQEKENIAPSHQASSNTSTVADSLQSVFLRNLNGQYIEEDIVSISHPNYQNFIIIVREKCLIKGKGKVQRHEENPTGKIWFKITRSGYVPMCEHPECKKKMKKYKERVPFVYLEGEESSIWDSNTKENRSQDKDKAYLQEISLLLDFQDEEEKAKWIDDIKHLLYEEDTGISSLYEQFLEEQSFTIVDKNNAFFWDEKTLLWQSFTKSFMQRHLAKTLECFCTEEITRFSDADTTSLNNKQQKALQNLKDAIELKMRKLRTNKGTSNIVPFAWTKPEFKNKDLCDKLKQRGRQDVIPIAKGKAVVLDMEAKQIKVRDRVKEDYCSFELPFTKLDMKSDDIQKELQDCEIFWGQLIEEVACFKRYGGAAIFGRNDKMLLEVCGPADSGKTLADTLLQEVFGFGQYFGTLPPGHLVHTRGALKIEADSASMHNTNIAGLYGCRLVTLSETQDKQYYNDLKLKQIVCGDAKQDRQIYQDVELRQGRSCACIIWTNNKIGFKEGTGEDVKKKVLQLQTRFAFVENPTKAGENPLDPKFVAGLKTEKARNVLFNWLLQGAEDHMHQGLNPPEAWQIQNTGSANRVNGNENLELKVEKLKQYIDEMTEPTDDEADIIYHKDLFKAYNAWFDEQIKLQFESYQPGTVTHMWSQNLRMNVTELREHFQQLTRRYQIKHANQGRFLRIKFTDLACNKYFHGKENLSSGAKAKPTPSTIPLTPLSSQSNNNNATAIPTSSRNSFTPEKCLCGCKKCLDAYDHTTLDCIDCCQNYVPVK